MTRAAVLCGAALVATMATGLAQTAPPPAAAPAPRVTGRAGVQLGYADLTEVDSSRSASGPALAGTFFAERARWYLDATLQYMWLSPKAGAGINAGQWDLRVGYNVIPTLGLEAGLGGRVISPAHAAQDVTTGRVGVRSEIAFARNTAVWGRGAFLVAPRFGDGGDYGLAIELAFGASIGTPDNRVHFRADYEFQRIDRRLGATALPIQLGVGRFGADLRW